MATELPHFTLPFRFVSAGADVVAAAVAEQESTDEIASCCEAVIRTVQGQRTSMPQFGRPEYEFNTDAEYVRSSLAAALLEYEPRVESLIEAWPDDNDPELQIVRAILAPRDGEEGEVS